MSNEPDFNRAVSVPLRVGGVDYSVYRYEGRWLARDRAGRVVEVDGEVPLSGVAREIERTREG